MMPRAKMVIRDMFRPENRSTKPNRDPFWDCQNSARAVALRPGFGICAADPVDREEEEGEDDPLPQLGDAEDIADAV